MNTSLKRSDVVRVSYGITQFYLPPTHEPYPLFNYHDCDHRQDDRDCDDHHKDHSHDYHNDVLLFGCSDIQNPAWRRTTLPQFTSACRRRAWSTSTPLCQIELSADSTVQTVNRRRSSVSGHSSTVLEQAS